MNDTKRILLSDELIDKWQSKLELPDNIRRMIIDLESGKAARIYFECFGDAALLEIEPPCGALSINVAEEDNESTD